MLQIFLALAKVLFDKWQLMLYFAVQYIDIYISGQNQQKVDQRKQAN